MTHLCIVFFLARVTPPSEGLTPVVNCDPSGSKFVTGRSSVVVISGSPGKINFCSFTALYKLFLYHVLGASSNTHRVLVLRSQSRIFFTGDQTRFPQLAPAVIHCLNSNQRPLKVPALYPRWLSAARHQQPPIVSPRALLKSSDFPVP